MEINSTENAVIIGPDVVPDAAITNLFVSFGSFVITTNILVVFITSSNKDLLKKSAFPIGLALGDMVFGLALFISGIKIKLYILDGTIVKLIRPVDCLKTYTCFWLLGVQLPASMIFLIGSERVLGVIFFQWYFNKWTNKLTLMLVSFAYGFCFISLTAIWITLYRLPENEFIHIVCKTPNVIGPSYGTFNYGLPVMCGISAVISSIISLVVYLKKRANMGQSQTTDTMKRFIKRQIQMTVTMLTLALIDLVLVVIPNIVLLTMVYDVYFPPEWKYLAAYAELLFGIRSSLSFFVYLALNRDFRAAALKLFCLEKFMKVVPQNASTNRTTSTSKPAVSQL